MSRIPDSVLENFRLAAVQGKLVCLENSPRYEPKADDPDELQLKDEYNATWVNFWRAAAEGKLIRLPQYDSKKDGLI
jgi:hypothetical protein